MVPVANIFPMKKLTFLLLAATLTAVLALVTEKYTAETLRAIEKVLPIQ